MPTTKTITATVKRNSWNEKPLARPGVSRASMFGEIDDEYTGDEMTGKAWTSTVMTYYGDKKLCKDRDSNDEKLCGDNDSDAPPPDCGVHYDGHAIFEGTLLGRTGGLVFVESGTCPAGGVLKSTLRILPGTATGELVGIKGHGTQTIDFTKVGPKPGDVATKEFTFELPW